MILSEKTIYPHVSVDCVVLGFDGMHFKVLLLKRTGMEGETRFSDLKLPGRLIYSNEDLDEAAQSVVVELIHSTTIFLHQFRSFGSPGRTSNPRDLHWLENAVKLKIGRIITVGYLALIRIDDKLRFKSDTLQATWVPVREVGKLAFDHNVIIQEAMHEVSRYVTMDPSVVFNLLPKRFTASQMRTLFEELFDQAMDVRNFHKKMSRMNYLVATDEFEHGVAHRAARFYRFDKKIYLKSHGGFNLNSSL
ncbi:MAG: DNA mismatch repair protein MutT [Bacteroidota bacterium]|nr:DNA mismatch repair protein MutT [Bacteroidota bacterium]